MIMMMMQTQGMAMMMMVVMFIGTQHTCSGITTLCLRLTCRHQAVKVEFVGVTFPMHFGHYIFVIIISVRNEKYLNRNSCAFHSKHIHMYVHKYINEFEIKY